ncbi:hypothetical protein JCM33374_g5151 [Metschnikowia sp. JCM 33374]|nr:hypothetical protein JCM33374_g5151 [Metschnikowia sp. JCM 33374]
MSPLSYIFVRCCFLILHTKKNDEIKTTQLAKVIDTLDLSPSNLAVALVYLSKYQANTINSLENNESDVLHYYIIIASLVLANKYINDQSYTLKTWHSILHKCSSIHPSLSMLNQLESNFLAALDFSLNTKHDPCLWGTFQKMDAFLVNQLRLAVDESSCVQHHPVPKVATPPITHYGLATPPSAFTTHTSPLAYKGTSSSSSSPSPGAPFTPLSVPTCIMGVPPMMPQMLQMYPSPAVHQTPQRRVRTNDEWQQSKRRRTGFGSCGSGFAFEPVYTASFNV